MAVNYSGWQSQADRTGVQDHIENALLQLTKEPVRIHCSGRTDAGVHARGQVFHFDAEWKRGCLFPEDERYAPNCLPRS
jgi:tRNA pseudouridine38-40 synthase